MTTPTAAQRNDVPSCTGKDGPGPFDARRERRRLVEDLLLRGEGPTRIAIDVARQTGVSSRMVRKDIRLLRRRWVRWEERGGHRRLALNVQRMDWAIREAMNQNPPDYLGAALIAYRQCRTLGYGVTNVFVDARQQALILNGGSGGGDPGRAEALRRIAERLEALSPVELRRALTPPALEPASGNGSNGRPDAP